jgi:hypothetical protein
MCKHEKKFETNMTPKCRVVVAQHMNYMTKTSLIKLKPCKPKQILIRGWMHNRIILYPSMVIAVTDSITAAIDKDECPYECTLSCLKRPKTWSSIDVTWWTTIGPCWYLLTHTKKDPQAHRYRWAFHPGDIFRVSYLFIRKEKACDD